MFEKVCYPFFACVGSLSTRVEWWLKKKNWTHVMLCQIVIGPQFQNFSLKYYFLAGRREFEHFDCYPKMGNSKKILKRFWSLCQGGIVFPLNRSKIKLPILGPKKKMEKLCSNFLFWDWSKRKIFANFLKKLLILRSLWFFCCCP